MRARLRVPIGNPRKSLMVTERAVGTDQGRKFVYVVTPKKDAEGKKVYKKDKDGNTLTEPVYQVEYRQVETGLQIGEFRVVKKGLALTAGEEFVVTKGQQRVRLNAQEKQEVEIKVDDTKYQKPESPVAGGQ
jgi:hypothetical protein